MRHAYVETTAQDPTDDRIQGDEWNADHTLGADENFVTDAEKALIALLGTTRYAETFDSTDLDGSGDITITHSRDFQYPQIIVVDDSGVKVDGYKVTFDDADNLTLRILGAGAFTGWRVEVISAPSVSRYSETFDNTDLDGSGDITFTHDRYYQYPQLMIVDDSGVRVDGYKVTYDSTTALTIRLLGAGAFTNWRIEIV